MNAHAARARLDQLHDEVRAKTANGTITHAYMDRVEAEAEELETQIRTHRKAVSMSSFSDSDQYRAPGMPTMKAVGGLGKSQPKWQPPSPLHADHTELKQLYDAACHRAGGFQIQLKTADTDTIHTKAAGAPIVETGGGFTLPSVISPGLQLLLPYEPDRLFSHFPHVNMDGPSAAFLQHTGNTNPAAAVGEGQPKPDLGMQLTEQVVKPTKIAALASATLEILQDYESFANWIPTELARALVNAETDQVVNGSGTAPNMLGILNTSGLLTRAMASDTPIDAIQKAFNDLRIGPAFATADLVVLPHHMECDQAPEDDLRQLHPEPRPIHRAGRIPLRRHRGGQHLRPGRNRHRPRHLPSHSGLDTTRNDDGRQPIRRHRMGQQPRQLPR